MVVDDHVAVRSSCKKALERHGYGEVACEETFARALEHAASGPALFLVDVNLGSNEPSGICLARELRKAGYQGCVCMLTASDDADTLYEALFAGADDYLVKPVSMLAREVEMLLARTRGEVRVAPRFDDAVQGRFLRARGLTDEQVEVMKALVLTGFPDGKTLAVSMGLSEKSLSKRLSRARETLKLSNESQLVHLLTVLSGYGSRWR